MQSFVFANDVSLIFSLGQSFSLSLSLSPVRSLSFYSSLSVFISHSLSLSRSSFLSLSFSFSQALFLSHSPTFSFSLFLQFSLFLSAPQRDPGREFITYLYSCNSDIILEHLISYRKVAIKIIRYHRRKGQVTTIKYLNHVTYSVLSIQVVVVARDWEFLGSNPCSENLL